MRVCTAIVTFTSCRSEEKQSASVCVVMDGPGYFAKIGDYPDASGLHRRGKEEKRENDRQQNESQNEGGPKIST
jgi:hypothetical protein